jgi:hypothetical protein
MISPDMMVNGSGPRLQTITASCPAGIMRESWRGDDGGHKGHRAQRFHFRHDFLLLFQGNHLERRRFRGRKRKTKSGPHRASG